MMFVVYVSSKDLIIFLFLKNCYVNGSPENHLVLLNDILLTLIDY